MKGKCNSDSGMNREETTIGKFTTGENKKEIS